LTEDCELFKDSIEPNDIKQGSLGSCHLMAAMAAIAVKPDRIRKIFMNQTRNEHGVHGVKLYKEGREPQLVMVNELLPTKDSSLQFSFAHGQELWAVILEKAYAKMYGSYSGINYGNGGATV